MRNLLRKIHFGHLLCKFSLFRVTKRLKFTKNLPQNDFSSRRLSFSDSLLADCLQHLDDQKHCLLIDCLTLWTLNLLESDCLEKEKKA
ncbi:Adenosylcobinamide-phosphate guanylyltransferase, partial [hydrothermal vent metagenome]